MIQRNKEFKTIGFKSRKLKVGKNPCSLPKATTEPEKVIAPMILPMTKAKEKICISPMAMHTTAPPPSPFKSATICGREVILIFEPNREPVNAPKMIADIKYSAFWGTGTKSETIARNIAKPLTPAPSDAVWGDDIKRIPRITAQIHKR